MAPQKYPRSANLRVGVLLAPPPVQFLDIAPVDLFHMLSKKYLSAIPMLPAPVKNLAVSSIDVVYIADKTEAPVTTYNGLSSNEEVRSDRNNSTITIAPLTADAKIAIDFGLEEAEVQPGQLSVLIVPGPDPETVPSAAYTSFIKAHANSGKTDIISVCTGIFPICYAGICDGYVVTGPRGLLPELRSKFKKVKEFEDKRWSKNILPATKSADGQNRSAELWTAAGITNGHDCIAAYIREHFDQELAEIVIRMADVEDRPRDYNTSQFSENAWWISRILKTIFKSFFKS